MFSAAEYTPPDVDGTDADAELRRVNTIVEMLIEGKRQVKNHPPPVKLAPVKPPSREHPEPEQRAYFSQWPEATQAWAATNYTAQFYYAQVLDKPT